MCHVLNLPSIITTFIFQERRKIKANMKFLLTHFEKILLATSSVKEKSEMDSGSYIIPSDFFHGYVHL